MTKYYIGFDSGGNSGQHWQVFAADSPDQATSEATGYLATGGPYDTQQEAKEIVDSLNR